MIDKEKFTNYYKAFDKEVVLEIINMFIEEYPERFEKLRRNIEDNDFENLQFNAHSLKGVIANFTYTEPHQLAKELEDITKEINQSEEKTVPEESVKHIQSTYNKLEEATKQLLEDLRNIRTEFE
ncbi:MAG: Hpt domain-containing protein [Bacteroidales bacterium]|nr:Hpt domain-containing protein [Bacteroidales bacterium]